MSISNLIISNAYADGVVSTQTGGSIMDFLPLIALLAVFYFLVLRPQQKRAKETKSMLSSLQNGDEVITIGGAVGRISKIGENYIGVEIAEGVTINVQKTAIQTVLPKGTIKSI